MIDLARFLEERSSMYSLSEFLDAAAKLPRDELKPGLPPESRREEMALLAEIIPQSQIDALRQSGRRFLRGCVLRNEGIEVRFEVTNHTTHRITLCRSRNTALVSDNGQPVAIETISELRAYITELAEVPT